jgi:regulator of PEP synthase PpsR (kinase-PPPase family)
MVDEVKRIVVVSDGTGRTAKRLMDAVLAQYKHKEVEFPIVKLFKEVRTMEEMDAILSEIRDDYLVLYSIISRDLSEYFHSALKEREILHLDVLEPMLSTMSKFLGVYPGYEPGILQVIDDAYYRKVDAIGYTVQHDDGRGQYLEEAEIVLLGLSRTCKTPLSMYLACNFGFRVANIPIVANEDLTQNLLSRLKNIPSETIFGLTMQPHVLAQIREERSGHITGQQVESQSLKDYSDVGKIRNELTFCRHLYAEQGWCQVNVTHRAVEEIAKDILHELGHPELYFGLS